MVLVIVDLVEFGDVWVVEALQDAHLVEESLMLFSVQVRFLDLFSRTNDACEFPFDLVDAAEASSSQLPPHLVVMQETAFFHLEKAFPPYFDFLDDAEGVGLLEFTFMLGGFSLIDSERFEIEKSRFAGWLSKGSDLSRGRHC